MLQQVLQPSPQKSVQLLLLKDGSHQRRLQTCVLFNVWRASVTPVR